MTEPLDLGVFSVSLSVADLDRSKAFYAALGFAELGGSDGYCIMGNGAVLIGLFHGMFEGNILTFNPGMPSEPPADGGMPEPVEGFTDVREIEARLLAAGIELTRGTETESGPDHITLVDPDGNQIMVDQFF